MPGDETGEKQTIPGRVSAGRRTLRRVMGTPLGRIALLLAILVLAGLVVRYMNTIERFFIYHPDRDILETPGDRGLAFEDVSFTTSDGVRLHGWFVPGRSGLTWVWFHGNAGNISHRLDNLVELHRHLQPNILIFDYRGYGRSEGAPSESGLYLDGEAVIDYLKSRHDVDGGRLVLFGRSLGCAVAAEMAAGHEVYAVVLESPFTSVRAMAKRFYPFLPGAGLLVRAKFDSLSKIKDVRAPVMVVHGDRDETAPFDMGRELYEAANEPKRFYSVEGAGHNDTYLVGGPVYYEALEAFLREPRAGR